MTQDIAERPIIEAFYLVSQLALKDGVSPLNTRTDCWVRKIDDQWTIAVNGTKAQLTCEPEGTMGAAIEPYHMAVWYGGWLAGLLSPYDGVLAAGSAANEETFVAALRTELARSESEAG